MSKSVLYMSMSLDGFIAGPNESWDANPLGDGGRPLVTYVGSAATAIARAKQAAGVTHLRYRVRHGG